MLLAEMMMAANRFTAPPVIQGAFTSQVPAATRLSGLRLGAGRGQALPPAVQAKMEQVFNADFSGVRIHVGPEAPSIGALAFTMGHDVYFAPGQYSPQTARGQQLLGHELAHVVQQRTGRARAPAGVSGVSILSDWVLEAEADRMGQRASMMMPQSATSPATPPRAMAQLSAAGPIQRRPAAAGPSRPRAPVQGGRGFSVRLVFRQEAAAQPIQAKFRVGIKYELPQKIDMTISDFVVAGEIEKPDASNIRGTKIKQATNRCHIIGWDALVISTANIFKGRKLRDAFSLITQFSPYIVNQLDANDIEKYVEGYLEKTYKTLQSNVNNYYNGRASQNKSGGGSYGAAKTALDSLYDKYAKRGGFVYEYSDEDAAEAFKLQKKMFRAGYDESDLFSVTERAISRNEYIARLYQTYYGLDRLKYAKYLVENGEEYLAEFVTEGLE